jgi:DNA-binding response OmpR family regulator
MSILLMARLRFYDTGRSSKIFATSPRSRYRDERLVDDGWAARDEAASARMNRPETNQSAVRTGKLVVNLDQRVALVDDRLVRLTGKEYDILELLVLHKGTPLTKAMILDHLYGGMDEPEVKIIDVFVCKLRKKLAQATGGSHYIETVWGRGYVLQDPITASG